MSLIQRAYIEFAKPKYDYLFVGMLLIGELILGTFIIKFVPYTEIDWEAYMEEIDCWLIDDEYDYIKIKGGTGPLVYPAGFLYLFAALQKITNRQIAKAQLIFLGFYIITQGIIFTLYTIVLQQIRRNQQKRSETTSKKSATSDNETKRCHEIWSFRIAMCCLCLSKRYHSIFLLRLFNDGPTMLLGYLSFMCFMNYKWNIGCFIFSLAVSLKMNILLFAPGLLYLLIQDNIRMTIPRLAICGITQVVLGAPFLFRYPVSYLRKAFELDRQFFYKWTVNFKFLSEDIFLSKQWSVFLLTLHVGLLVVYHYRLYNSQQRNARTSEQILSTLFVSNFIGISCARTLHYQFYSWYFSALSYLLWRETPYNIPMKLCLLGCIEYAFLTFPATPLSSIILQIAHWSILIPCVMVLPSNEENYITQKSTQEKLE